MAQVKTFGGYPSASSRVVLDVLAARLPDTTYLVPDVSLSDSYGRLWQFDLLILAPHGTYVVELCHWTGRIHGDGFQWSVDGEARWVPQSMAQAKANALRDILVGRDPRLLPLWFEPVTVLTQSPAALDISSDGRPGILGPKALATLVADSTKIPLRARDGLAAEQVALALERVAKTSTEPLVFGNYRVVDHLEASSTHDLFRVIPADPSDFELSKNATGPLFLRADRGADVAHLRSRHEAWSEVPPNSGLVAVLDLFEDEQLGACIVYREPAGRTLRMLLHQGIESSEAVVLGWFRDCAEALVLLGNHGIVHGRVAPENIVIAADTRARLVAPAPLPLPFDHGVNHIATPPLPAEFLARSVAPGVSDFVDPAFVAPEVSEAQLGEIDGRTDIFGLGASLHFLYAGETDSIRSGSYAAPKECPEQLRELLPSMLELEASDRVTTLEPLLDALDDLIASQRRSLDLSGVPQVRSNEIIDNRYEVKRRLGIGHAWATFLLHDGADGSAKVGKVFDPVIGPGGLERLARRSPAGSKLPQPTMVTDSSDRLWMIVDFIDGTPLSELIDSGDKLVPAEAVALIDALLQVLSEIHPDAQRIAELTKWGTAGLLRPEERSTLRKLRTDGVVHGDLKPSSIIRVPGGVMLVDPLLRFDHAELPAPEHGYIDPDPESGVHRWDVGPDLFAVGVLFYEMVCGAHPFASGIPNLGEQPQDPSIFAPALSGDLRSLLLKACAPRRSDRFVDAPEMRREMLQTTQMVVDRDVLAHNAIYRSFWTSVRDRAEIHNESWFSSTSVPEEWAVRFRTLDSGIALGGRVLRHRVETILEFPIEQDSTFQMLRAEQARLADLAGSEVVFDDDFRQVLVSIDGFVHEAGSRSRLGSAVADQAVRLLAAASEVGGFTIEASTESAEESATTGSAPAPPRVEASDARVVSDRWVLSTSDGDDETLHRVNRSDLEAASLEAALDEDRNLDDEGSGVSPVESGPDEPQMIDLTEEGIAKIESQWLEDLSLSQNELVDSLIATTRILGGAVANDPNSRLVLAWAVRERSQPLPLLLIDADGITMRTDLLASLQPFDSRRALRTLRHRLANFVETDWMGLTSPVAAKLTWPASESAAAELNQIIDWIIRQIDTQPSEDIMSATWVSEVLVRSVDDVLSEASRLGVLVDDIPLITRRSAFVVAAELGVVADELQ